MIIHQDTQKSNYIRGKKTTKVYERTTITVDDEADMPKLLKEYTEKFELKLEMIEKEQVAEAIGSYMEEKNLTLVEIKVNKANNIKVFFSANGRPVTIDDCVALSRHIEGNLDRDKEDFSLMVSSAGGMDTEK